MNRNKDLVDCQKYCATGIVIAYLERGESVSVEELRTHWNSVAWNQLYDAELQTIIDVQKNW